MHNHAIERQELGFACATLLGRKKPQVVADPSTSVFRQREESEGKESATKRAAGRERKASKEGKWREPAVTRYFRDLKRSLGVSRSRDRSLSPRAALSDKRVLSVLMSYVIGSLLRRGPVVFAEKVLWLLSRRFLWHRRRETASPRNERVPL